eukprot:9497067-Pyramimonas_sp.AAC.3
MRGFQNLQYENQRADCFRVLEILECSSHAPRKYLVPICLAVYTCRVGVARAAAAPPTLRRQICPKAMTSQTQFTGSTSHGRARSPFLTIGCTIDLTIPHAIDLIIPHISTSRSISLSISRTIDLTIDLFTDLIGGFAIDIIIIGLAVDLALDLTIDLTIYLSIDPSSSEWGQEWGHLPRGTPEPSWTPPEASRGAPGRRK